MKKNIDTIRTARKEIQARLLAAKDAALLPEIAVIYRDMDAAYAVLENIHVDVLPRAAKYTSVLKLMKPEMAADFMKVATGVMPVETLAPLADDPDPIVAATVGELMKLTDQLHKATDLDRELDKFQLVTPVEVTVTVHEPVMITEAAAPTAATGEPLASQQRNRFEQRYAKYQDRKKQQTADADTAGDWQQAMKEAKGDIPKSYFTLSVPGVEEGRYAMNSAGNLYDAYAKKSFAPTLLQGKMQHTLNGMNCSYFTYTVEQLRKYMVLPATEEVAVNAEEPAATTEKKEVEWVWLDWIAELPRRKYRVYRDGSIYDTLNEEWLQDLSGGKVYLSAGSIEDRSEGVRCYKTSIYRKSVVFRAFFPKVAAGRVKLRIKFRDGNERNCNADNLYLAGDTGWM